MNIDNPHSTLTPEMREIRDFLRTLSPEQRSEFLSQLDPEHLRAIKYCWEIWARPKQMLPDFEYSTDKAGNRRKLGVNPLTGEQLRWDIWALIAGRRIWQVKGGQ